MVALRNTRQVPSRSHPGVTHTQWFDGAGRMIGCTCDEAKAVHVAKYNFKHCHHMLEWNEPKLNSCLLCGYLTKGVICFRCS